ncbi:MAG: YbhB/YbcL family Raf kinase inhibitor-like protein [Myxococcales bacterium]
MTARTVASLLVLGCCALLLSECDAGESSAPDTPSAGSPALAGGGATGGGATGGSGAPAVAGGGSGAGGASGAGGGGAGGANPGGAAGVSAGGLGAGGASGGSAAGSSGAAGAAGGAGGSSAGAAGQAGGSSAGFALTSAKLSAGTAFAADFTCAGADHSPPLAWTAGPSGTLSYALVLQDTNNMLNHWVLWDIPPATSSLSESLATTATLTTPAGAKQIAFQGNGYMGPCPSGMLHTYVFTLYALDVAMLPGVTAASTTANVAAAIQMHDLASAALSATSDAKMP